MWGSEACTGVKTAERRDFWYCAVCGVQRHGIGVRKAKLIGRMSHRKTKEMIEIILMPAKVLRLPDLLTA